MFKKNHGSRMIAVAVFVFSMPFLFSQETAVFQKIISELSFYEKAVQVLMVNIAGNTTVDSNTVAPLKGVTPGAVLLFGYNLAHTPQGIAAFLTSGIRKFQETAGQAQRRFIPPFYALDNEGGLVYRTRAVTAPLPSAEDTGKFFSVEETRLLYSLLGKQMRELGILLNLAPVAEPQTQENSAVLDTRMYSTEPEQAAAYAAAAVDGIQTAGVLATVKHFPGNGAVDLHQGSAVLTVDRDTLLKRYAAPFRPSITAGAAAVLISHVTVPAVEAVPFCFSAAGIALLRHELGFSGIVITDDIAMQALQGTGQSAADNAIRALAAGCDMVMCSDRNIFPIVAAIAERAGSDDAFARQLDAAVLRILHAKHRAGLINATGDFTPHTPDWQQFNSAKEEATRLVQSKKLR